jgi:DNA-binding CsgD family transcriptional regulator/PAS domain-containing protein
MVVRETEQLSTLIGDIYDAALEASLWTDVLKKAREFVGGRAAALLSKDACSNSGNVYYSDGGIEPRYERLYFDKYIKLDPCTVGHFFAQIEEPVATADLLSYDEFLETRMYKEWARPQRLVDCVMCVLEKSTTSVALFCVFRHQRDGVIDDEARRRLQLIVPHIRRAVLIGKVVDLKTTEAATLSAALDGLSAGMFLVDETGRIVHANAAGLAILRASSYLRAAGGRLVASAPETDRLLSDTFSAAANGDAAVGTKGVALPLMAQDGERHVAHVLPLTSGARRRAIASHAAVAAVFVHKAALDTPSAPEAIAKAYKLTPTELRVLLAIVEVGGVPEVAEALGVAVTTVKTHLGNLYEKTGAGRQADLVKLVAGFSSPLVG